MGIEGLEGTHGMPGPGSRQLPRPRGSHPYAASRLSACGGSYGDCDYPSPCDRFSRDVSLWLAVPPQQLEERDVKTSVGSVLAARMSAWRARVE